MKPIKDFDCVKMKWDIQQKQSDLGPHFSGSSRTEKRDKQNDDATLCLRMQLAGCTR